MILPIPLAETTPWTLWIPFAVFFCGLVIAMVGAWLSGDPDP